MGKSFRVDSGQRGAGRSQPIRRRRARFEYAQQAIDFATLAIGSEAVGCMEVLYKDTVEYCKNREQFGQPIGKFQVLQHRMVDMFMEHEQSKSLMFMAAMRWDESYGAEAQKAVSAFKVQVGKSGKLWAKARCSCTRDGYD